MLSIILYGAVALPVADNPLVLQKPERNAMGVKSGCVAKMARI
jgi:hypothetical protein